MRVNYAGLWMCGCNVRCTVVSHKYATIWRVNHHAHLVPFCGRAYSDMGFCWTSFPSMRAAIRLPRRRRRRPRAECEASISRFRANHRTNGSARGTGGTNKRILCMYYVASMVFCARMCLCDCVFVCIANKSASSKFHHDTNVSF